MHGQVSRFSDLFLPLDLRIGSGHIYIVCGDFGFLWKQEQDESELKDIEYISDRIGEGNYLLVVGGNHENYDRLYRLPKSSLFGGSVRQLNKNIYFLERGEIYDLPYGDGTTRRLFAFGGAASTDRMFRKEGISWWREELPTTEEIRHAEEMLSTNEGIDFVVTHVAPKSLHPMMRIDGYPSEEEELQMFLESTLNRLQGTSFRWFFGHYHFDKRLGPHFQCCYLESYEV